MAKKHEPLRQLMKSKGYNLGMLAKELGIGYKALTYKMRGLNQFKWNEVVTICRLLGIENPIGWFE